MEAHGTSTKVGDATELSTLSRLWTGVEGTGNVAVGSVKSQIGHYKAAAGIAGIMKSVMALHHGPSLQVPISRRQIPYGGLVQHSVLRTDRTPRMAPVQRRIHAVQVCPRSDSGGTNFPSHSRVMSPIITGRWRRIGTPAGQPTVDKQPLRAPSIFDGSLPATMSHEALKAVEGRLASLN